MGFCLSSWLQGVLFALLASCIFFTMGNFDSIWLLGSCNTIIIYPFFLFYLAGLSTGAFCVSAFLAYPCLISNSGKRSQTCWFAFYFLLSSVLGPSVGACRLPRKIVKGRVTMCSDSRVIFSVDMGLPSDPDIKSEVVVSLASAISLMTMALQQATKM